MPSPSPVASMRRPAELRGIARAAGVWLTPDPPTAGSVRPAPGDEEGQALPHYLG